MALKYSTLFSLLLEIFQIAIQSYQHLSPSLLTSRIFILFFTCICACACACVHIHVVLCVVHGHQKTTCKSQFSPAAVRCRNWAQVIRLGGNHPYPLNHFCWPLLISNCIKPSYHDFLMDILNDRAQIRDREPSSGCSVSMY